MAPTWPRPWWPRGPPQPPRETGTLNFLATAVAEVLVDDKKVGTTPLRGQVFKVGSYRIQFVCAGARVRSPQRLVEVLPFTETDIEHRCP